MRIGAVLSPVQRVRELAGGRRRTERRRLTPRVTALRALAVAAIAVGSTCACIPAFPVATPGTSTPSAATPGGATPGIASSSAPATAEPTVNAAVGREWTRLPASGALRNAELAGVTSHDGSLLAVGSIVSVAERRIDGAIWRSPDGRVWTKVAAGPDFTNTSINRVHAAADGRLIATGSNCYYEGECLGFRVWTSLDGNDWQAARSSLEEESAVNAQVRGRPGEVPWIGVGISGSQGGPGFGQPAAWTSTDGINWFSAPGVGEGNGSVDGVTRWTKGYVAYGMVYDSDEQPAAAVWTSGEGNTWHRVAAATGPRGESVTAVAEVGTTLAAFVRQPGGQTEVWNSGDGVGWRRSAASAAPFELSGESIVDVRTVVTIGDRAIAFGTAETSPGKPVSGTWISTDGRAWLRGGGQAALEEGHIRAATPHGGHLFAVGALGCPVDDCRLQGLVWQSPP